MQEIHDRLPLTHPQMGTWPATQACALTGNRTSGPLVCRLARNPLSHTSQDMDLLFGVWIVFACKGNPLHIWGKVGTWHDMICILKLDLFLL